MIRSRSVRSAVGLPKYVGWQATENIRRKHRSGRPTLPEGETKLYGIERRYSRFSNPISGLLWMTGNPSVVQSRKDCRLFAKSGHLVLCPPRQRFLLEQIDAKQ